MKIIINESYLNHIISESIKKILLKEDEIMAKNVQEKYHKQAINYLISKRPDLDPSGFYYDKWTETVKYKSEKASKKPKKERVKLIRKDGESNASYAQRLAQIDPNFAKEYKKHEGEEFRPIENVMGRLMGGNVDYTDTYEVSNMGTFRVMDGVEGRGVYPKPYLQKKHGQEFEYQVHLTKGNDGCFIVKNIVAFAFPDIVEQPFNLSDYQSYAKFTKHWGIVHIDGDKSNNAAENLKWVSRRLNKKTNI